MAYKQLRKFDRRKAGTKAYYCLRNVRMGYGIAPKYEAAWDSWQNAPQHTSPIPSGVDVPVYFSFRATLGGKYRNWGHIAVRLADGRVWTDGRYYSSVHDLANQYLNNGKYVGWSDEVNDVKVIKEEADMSLVTFIKQAYQAALGRSADAGGLKHYQSSKYNDPKFILNDLMNSNERKIYVAREKAQDEAREAQGKTIAQLRAQLETVKKNSKADELKAALGRIGQLTSELEVAHNKLEDAQAELEAVRDAEPVEVETPLTWQTVIPWVINKIKGGK